MNAAEGEPGSFKDRALVRRNPYRVLEGAVIASLAVGSGEILVGVKASFRPEIERLGAALAEMRAAGWLEGIEARIVQGPSE